MRAPDWQTADGRVRLFRGDCLEVLPMKADVCITDPPFELVAKGGGIGAKRKYMNDIEGHLDDGFDFGVLSHFPNWMAFCAKAQLPAMLTLAAAKRWMLVTWNKTNPTPLVNSNYLPDTEYIVHAWEPGNLFGTYGDRSRFIVHPVEK